MLGERIIIPILKDKAKQPIYEDGPKWHLSKSGTPTMGGLAFVIAIGVCLLICSGYLFLIGKEDNAVSLLLSVTFSLLNAAVGIIDDMTKLRNNRNAGLTPKAKLILQFIIAFAFLIGRQYILNDGYHVNLTFGKLDFGILYYPITLIILVGIINFANLTDGIDGLASSVAFAIGISLFYISYSKSDSATFICAAMIGASVGFLVYNIHPAKIFMGDTGSLFLGAMVASVAMELKNPLIAVISGAVYVIEGVSVILQVAFYKLCKKRIFKMAPIHHHLEQCGWEENKICIYAIIITLLFCTISKMVYV